MDPTLKIAQTLYEDLVDLTDGNDMQMAAVLQIVQTLCSLKLAKATEVPTA